MKSNPILQSIIMQNTEEFKRIQELNDLLWVEQQSSESTTGEKE